MTYQGKYQGKWGGAFANARLALIGAVMAGLAMFAAPGHAATISVFPASLDIAGGANFLSIGDTWIINITGNNAPAGQLVLKVTAQQDLPALTTSTLNLPNGFLNPTVQWNTDPGGGVATVIASLSSAQLTSGSLTSMLVSFAAGDTMYLIADWAGTQGLHTWDIRIEAIPLPAGLLLFLSGLAGIGFLGRYKASRREPAAA